MNSWQKGVKEMSVVEYIQMFVEYFTTLITTLKKFFEDLSGGGDKKDWQKDYLLYVGTANRIGSLSKG